MSSKRSVCIIIGYPVRQSLSPLLHNKTYEYLKIDHNFVYVYAEVQSRNLQSAVEGFKTFGFRGLAVTIPHKTVVVQYLDRVDEAAGKIKAVNTVVNENGVFVGYNTDYLGVLKPLQKVVDLEGKRGVVIGAGGAARACCYALNLAGVEFCIVNRTLKKAEEVAEDFGAEFYAFDRPDVVQSADIVIQATSVGMEDDRAVLDGKDIFRKGQVVFDVVYKPSETRFLKNAKRSGAETISGVEMLLYQAVAQFELFTNRKAPVGFMREILYRYSGIKQ